MPESTELINSGIWNFTAPVRCCDLALYEWFLHRPADYDRYFFFEYDTNCNMGIDEFYGVIAHPVVCSVVMLNRPQINYNMFAMGDKWEHFNEMTPDLAPYACGAVPVCGISFAHKALVKTIEILRNPRYRDLFCEYRIATAAAQAGFRPEPIGRPARHNIWCENMVWPANRGIWHCVKK